MPSPAVYFSRFKPTYDSGGGSRRMLQIYELFKKACPDLRLECTAGGDKHERRLKKKIRMESDRRGFFARPRRSPSIKKWHENHLSLAYRLNEFSKIWAQSVTGRNGCDLVIMDDPIYFKPLMQKLLRLGIPVVASCQNLETLAPNQVKKKWALEFFSEELAILSRCRLVITVSREEDVLLNNLGIPSLFIPYYPGEPILQRLLTVRENRKKNVKDGFLVIGNAKNLQTREGMKNLARYWQENRMDIVAGKLLLGGYKSDEFFTAGQFGGCVEFLGTFANDALDQILSRAKACICYQETGAGSLTRIGEMLIAGIPVIANSHAARSYYNRQGVIEFRELDELRAALGKADEFDGDIPLPRVPDCSALSLEIQRILR